MILILNLKNKKKSVLKSFGKLRKVKKLKNGKKVYINENDEKKEKFKKTKTDQA